MKAPRIEKGIPVPDGQPSRLRTFRATIKAMAPGESFTWPDDVKSVYLAASQIGVKVTIRKENGTGSRVWRVR